LGHSSKLDGAQLGRRVPLRFVRNDEKKGGGLWKDGKEAALLMTGDGLYNDEEEPSNPAMTAGAALQGRQGGLCDRNDEEEPALLAMK
jgi:hypothetical protein